MQFLIIAYDGEDEHALERRMAARPRHIELSDDAIKKGEQIVGAAILDDNNNMRGSAMIVEFESKEKLDYWLEKEPYVIGNVWKKIDVIPCKVGPSFQHILIKSEK